MPIDYSKYPKNWKSEIVPRILLRADNKCEFCGVENKAELTSIPLKICHEGKYKARRFWITDKCDVARMAPFALDGEVKIIKVVLTIAHLDHDETNHDVPDERLKALCQYCHLGYDASEKYRRACEKKPESRQDDLLAQPA
jgi:hypothetical protein